MAEAILYYGGTQEALDGLQKDTVQELLTTFPGTFQAEETGGSLTNALVKLYYAQEEFFIFIIDEWDAIYREEGSMDAQTNYTNLLRLPFKGSTAKQFIRLAYLTGILPIKRYNNESAPSNFREYTIISQKALSEYVGFTDTEVRVLCNEWRMDYDKMMMRSKGYLLFSRIHILCLAI